MSRSFLRFAVIFVVVLAALIAPAATVGAGQAQGEGPKATVMVGAANVRSGPGLNWPVIGVLRRGAVLDLSGRNAADTWWYGCCVNGEKGWISRTVTKADGNTAAMPILTVSATATPRPAPAPTPTPAPQSFPQWKAEYFNDIKLEGEPLLVRNDQFIDFNWGIDSPDPRVPADNFSVRWTRTINFTGGNYLFKARTSDGVRIYLDSLRVLDEWHDTVGYPTYINTFRYLGAGWHTVTVEYYERGGIAYATVWWEAIATPQ